MKRGIRFVIVSKVAHPWFDEVHKGALDEARLLKNALGTDVDIDYLAPSSASATEQNSVLRKAADGKPDGIAVDPVDAPSNMPEIFNIRSHGIPLILFDSPSPEPGITSVGNDFAQQGIIAAERLARLLRERGKVAVMQGVPTAPNHRQRYEAQIAVLKTYPRITIVDGGVDNDNIETAGKQAAIVLASNPDLSG